MPKSIADILKVYKPMCVYTESKISSIWDLS